MCRLRTRLLASLLSLLPITGCDDQDTGPSGPAPTGNVRVAVSTFRPEFGSDGYLIQVDGAHYQSVAVNDTVVLTGFAPGRRRLELDGVPTSCEVLGTADRYVTVAAGETHDAGFAVSCNAMGAVLATLSTTGADPDPDGYDVVVQEVGGRTSRAVRVGSNGTTLIPRLMAGMYAVSLTKVAVNCDVAEPSSPQARVETRGLAPVSLAVACAPVTQLLYVARVGTDTSDIFLVNSNGTQVTNLTNHPARDGHPAWSPDGRTIAFTRTRLGVRDIYLMDANGQHQRPLTTGGGSNPSWSPDGRRIVYTSGRDGNFEIYAIDADGTGNTRLTTNAVSDLDPAWSPDGQKIAFVRELGQSTEVFLMNADGTNPTRLIFGAGIIRDPAWSPDGRELAFGLTTCAAVQCTPRVMVAALNSPGTLTSVGLGTEPAWSPDGGKIAYTGHTCQDYYYYYAPADCAQGGIQVAWSGGRRTGEVIRAGPASHAVWRP